MEKREILVLGTPYTIAITDQNEDKSLFELDGYCDYSSKRIVIKDFNNVTGAKASDFPHVHANLVLRHEIIHAFLYESGLSNYRSDETLIDWLAIQFPKMATLFSTVEINLEPKE